MPGMNMQKFSIGRVAAILFLLIGLSACQTTGIDKKNIQTSFAPAGWEVHKRGKVTVYACPPSRCKTPQFVAVGPIRVKGDAEAAIRHDVVSKELFDAAANFVRVASRGSYKPSPARKISTKTYTGFELVEKHKTRGGNIYVASRSIIQKNKGSAVLSIATNRSVAVQNLKRFFTKTSILR